MHLAVTAMQQCVLEYRDNGRLGLLPLGVLDTYALLSCIIIIMIFVFPCVFTVFCGLFN